jgi:multicomponent Na+:H+ antiporter subunit F
VITQLAVWYVVMPLLLVAAVLSTIRLLRGPSLPDRIVALDLLAVVCIGLCATFAIGVGQPVFVDLVLVLGLLAFLGTVAFARYIERRGIDG